MSKRIQKSTEEVSARATLSAVKITEWRTVRGDFLENTAWMALVVVGAGLYFLLSAGAFLYFERSCPWATGWTLDDVVYFTALNILSGNSQPGFEACNVWGKALTIANPLAGLTLFGVFIALITMIFQRSELTLPGGLTPQASLALLGDVLQGKPLDPAQDALRSELEQEIKRAEQIQIDADKAGQPGPETARMLDGLRRALGQLCAAQEICDQGEKALIEAKAEARTRLQIAGIHLGLKGDTSMPTIRYKSSPEH